MIATTLGTVEEAAEELVGNWMSFNDFSWDRSSELEDADQYCLVYTHNRDSGLLDQSNAEAIHQALMPFLNKDVLEEHHTHWACGWCEGYAIKIFKRAGSPERFVPTSTSSSGSPIIHCWTRMTTRHGYTKRPSKTSMMPHGE